MSSSLLEILSIVFWPILSLYNAVTSWLAFVIAVFGMVIGLIVAAWVFPLVSNLEPLTIVSVYLIGGIHIRMVINYGYTYVSTGHGSMVLALGGAVLGIFLSHFLALA